jgi:hypothetical protein
MTRPLNEGAENEESQQALNFGMAHAFVGAQHNSVTAAIDALEIDYRPNDFARNRTPRRAAENAEDVTVSSFQVLPPGTTAIGWMRSMPSWTLSRRV